MYQLWEIYEGEWYCIVPGKPQQFQTRMAADWMARILNTTGPEDRYYKVERLPD